MVENKPVSPKSILIFVIVLFALIASLSVANYLSSIKNTPLATIQPTEEPTITPAATLEPTATPTSTPNMDITSWKTYTNKEYNFEIKYPEIFTFEPLTQDDNDPGIVGILRTKDSNAEVSGSVKFTIKKEKFDVKNVKITAEEMKYTPYVLIDGVQSYIMAGGDGPCGFAYVAIPRDSYYIRILFSDCGSSDNKIYFANDYLDQMLSTFKFIK